MINQPVVASIPNDPDGSGEDPFLPIWSLCLHRIIICPYRGPEHRIRKKIEGHDCRKTGWDDIPPDVLMHPITVYIEVYKGYEICLPCCSA